MPAGPFFTTAQKVFASDGASFDNFGNSVDIDGDTAVVGSFRDGDGTDSGAAYVFVRNGGTWTEQQKLVPSDGSAGDLFGRSVAISGDTIAVSALADDDNGLDSGSAYVFVRNGDIWSEQQKLLPSDGSQGDQAGWSLDLDGDALLLGVWLDGDNGPNSGSAYVFVRNAGIWSEQQKLLPDDGAVDERFGISVSISGDTALIAAMVDDQLGAESGSAYVFVRNAQSWSQQQKLLASDGAAFDRFGISVAVNRDRALIGSWHDDDLGSDSGSAYLYVRNGAVWSEQQKLVASDGAAGEEFGYSVALSGDTALIGAFSDNDNGVTSGSSYAFRLTGGSWVEQQKLLAKDGRVGDQYGVSVAIDENTAVIGSWWHDSIAENSGSAYFLSTEPVCDVAVDKTSYTDGEVVSTERFRFLVSISQPAAIEWKTWLKGPDQAPQALVNRGADGTFVLSAGTDLDLGSIPLFTVSPAMLRGAYSLDCRFLDPVTGTTRSLDRNRFIIQ
jgi:hypothetical protein